MAAKMATVQLIKYQNHRRGIYDGLFCRYTHIEQTLYINLCFKFNYKPTYKSYYAKCSLIGPVEVELQLYRACGHVYGPFDHTVLHSSPYTLITDFELIITNIGWLFHSIIQ